MFNKFFKANNEQAWESLVDDINVSIPSNMPWCVWSFICLFPCGDFEGLTFTNYLHNQFHFTMKQATTTSFKSFVLPLRQMKEHTKTSSLAKGGVMFQ